MYNTRLWLQELRRNGFRIKRNTGGHAIFSHGQVSITVPVHLRELPVFVVHRIRRAIDRVAERTA